MLELVPASFKAIYADFYLRLVERAPRLWSWLYEKTDRAPRNAWFSRVRRAVERVNTRGLRDCIDEYAPDAILCTHFLPAELLARRRARGDALPPVFVQVTDFDLHRLWVHEGLDGYCVANDEVAFRLRALLPVAPDLAVTGIPILPAFGRTSRSRRLCREARPGRTAKRRLVMTGGAGIGGGAGWSNACSASTVISASSPSPAATRPCSSLARSPPAHRSGCCRSASPARSSASWPAPISRSPSPEGSASECLARGLPMILVAPIPGQEERNAGHLLEQGAACSRSMRLRSNTACAAASATPP